MEWENLWNWLRKWLVIKIMSKNVLYIFHCAYSFCNKLTLHFLRFFSHFLFFIFHSQTHSVGSSHSELNISLLFTQKTLIICTYFNVYLNRIWADMNRTMTIYCMLCILLCGKIWNFSFEFVWYYKLQLLMHPNIKISVYSIWCKVRLKQTKQQYDMMLCINMGFNIQQHLNIEQIWQLYFMVLWRFQIQCICSIDEFKIEEITF